MRSLTYSIISGKLPEAVLVLQTHHLSHEIYHQKFQHVSLIDLQLVYLLYLHQKVYLSIFHQHEPLLLSSGPLTASNAASLPRRSSLKRGFSFSGRTDAKGSSWAK